MLVNSVFTDQKQQSRYQKCDIMQHDIA